MKLMGIRKYKPTTPGRRGASVADFAEITRSTPEKSLVRPLHGKGGRNAHGRITTRHQGGGHKRAYRVIDFRRNDKDGVPAKVAHIEYDPNRTARIALLHYADGEKRYIIAPQRLSQGDRVESGPNADIKPGNNLPLRNIPTGTVVHADRAAARRRREDRPLGRRRASSWSAKDGPYAQLRMPSGEIRSVDVRCRATVGEVGNAEQSNINWGKAGRMRWKGKRPTVRGVAMNPVDHPHGGGEGKTSGGRHPVSPWGQPEGRTRQPNKASDKLIVRRRRTGKKSAEQEGVEDATQSQEGPVRRRPPAQEGGRAEREGHQERHQDLVAPLDDHPGHARPHDRRARRPQARPGVRHRVDGRAQARRVRADPDVQGSHQGRPEGAAP